MTDDKRDSIIRHRSGAALLLAGPGCGKTHILAQRVLYANNNYGVPFDQMLCLTFTNRAAREMIDRITNTIGSKPHGLFVGNLHRFCLQFLFANKLVPADTSVFDEEDSLEYLASEFRITSRTDTKRFYDVAAFLYQTSHDHPAPVCRHLNEAPSDKEIARAEAYAKYKADNRLIDFDDIILQSYTALISQEARGYEMTGYTWVQVDEVQDLTPLQLAIVDLVTSQRKRCLLFMGDEQQAIFAFLGAGGVALKQLKRLCAGNIFHLTRNFRAPDYLVELTNSVARDWLDADPALLPKAEKTLSLSDPLIAFGPENAANSCMLSASIAREWLAANKTEDVAILARTNAEASTVSDYLNRHGLAHFLVSQNDDFHGSAFKTLWAHLSAVANPLNMHAWARIIYQTHATTTLKSAREYVKALSAAALTPGDIFAHLQRQAPSAIHRYAKAVNSPERTIIVLDTETTGLDIFRDDIVQIAALKIRGGKIVEGSQIDIFIETNRAIPRILGNGLRNPLPEIYDKAEKLPPAVAFGRLIDYIGTDDVVAGHNVAFDLAILAENISRRTNLLIPAELCPESMPIDTLTLSRLLYPRLRSHRLGFLLKHLGIEGKNSHMAADDTAATAMLLLHLKDRAETKLALQAKFFSGPGYMRVAEKLYQRYSSLYQDTSAQLLCDSSGKNALLEELTRAYKYFLSKGYISEIRKFNYISDFIDAFVVDTDHYRNFREQVSQYLAELRTFRESDLYFNGVVNERLSVMTIHKAKGLEMDNVILYNTTDFHGLTEESTRVLYVGMSRAKKRLAVGFMQRPKKALAGVLDRFRLLSPDECRIRIIAERLNRL